MDELERKIKSYLKQNLRIEIREEISRLETHRTVFVELFLDEEKIGSDELRLPIE